jgi:hypothetical protein
MMSTYQSTANYPPHDTSGATAARPTSLTAAVGAAIGVAVLNLISAIAIVTSVSDLVREQIADNPGAGEAPLDPALVDMASDRARGLETIYSGLAYSMIFWALVLGILAYFALRGGRVTRILATVILVVTAALKAADPVLTLPTISLIADVIVGLLALAAIVMFFLPASNAYGRQRRAASRPTAP